MGALIERFGDIDSVQGYAAALQTAEESIHADDYNAILKINQDTGEWVFGEDDTPLEAEDDLALNITSFKWGYVAFSEKENGPAFTVDGEEAQFLYPITQALPRKDELPEIEPETVRRDGEKKEVTPQYKIQYQVDLVVVNGPNKGTELTYSPTSHGGKKLMKKLMGELKRRLIAKSDECVPVMEFYTSSYHHKGWKKDIFNPEIDFLEWVSIAKGFDSEEETEVEKPKGRSKTTAKKIEHTETPEDADDHHKDDEPKRSRRSRSAAKHDSESDDAPKERRRRTSSERSEELDESTDERPARGRGRRARTTEVAEDAEEQPARGRRRRR